MSSWRLILFCLFFAFSSFVHASVTKYELPHNHVLQKPLKELFKDLDLLSQSYQELQDAGFEVLKYSSIVVAKHPRLKGYVIKFFISDIPEEEQIQNFVTRVQGSKALQEFIAQNDLQYIVTPKKWLYELQDKYILIAEDMNILSASETRKAYSKLASPALDELCMTVKKFRGLDSIIKNMPFTKSGKIAFIDTEKWKISKPFFLRHITPLLDPEGRRVVATYQNQELYQQWLLPENHPLHAILPTYFTSSILFDGPEILTKHGFAVNKRIHQKMMVFTHPNIPGYIFKRFQNSVPYFDQVGKYLIRLKGAEKVRAVISENRLSHIVVPQKWLYRLPYSDDEYLVIAEKFDICPGDDAKDGENVQRYRTMSLDVLRELCIAMKALGGCDAWPRNQPFTRDGKIAFIDTEHVGHKEWHFEKYIMPLLDKEQRAFARKMLE